MSPDQPSPIVSKGYAEIIERLERASGPDRGLDARIWCVFAGVKYRSHNPAYGSENLTQVCFTEPPKRTERVTLGHGPHRHAKSVTASLDASLALVGERLPGWRVAINSDDHRGPEWAAMVKQHGQLWPDPELAPTAPLAVLLAMFRALEEMK